MQSTKAKAARTVRLVGENPENGAIEARIVDGGRASDYVFTPYSGGWTTDKYNAASGQHEAMYFTNFVTGRCDCKAGQARKVECRHVAGLRALVNRIALREGIDR